MSAVRLLSWSIHEAIDYLAGVFLILAPFIFGFREGVAFPVFVAVGVLFLVNAVLTPGPFGVVSIVPVPVHAGVDYALAFLLILAPFVFGFTATDAALLSSMFLGLALLVLTLITAFPMKEGVEPQPPVTEP
ncbi:MAG: hypothetical protein GEU81_05795 [Nitriliruptorales bacterium]|nr:hypothetical protein [Nitriliruptorales bacterium]